MSNHQNSIFKYALRFGEPNNLSLTAGSKFLYAAEQHNCICVWYEVPHGPQQIRSLQNIPTGEAVVPKLANHLSSVLANGGNFVWHIYELVKDFRT